MCTELMPLFVDACQKRRAVNWKEILTCFCGYKASLLRNNESDLRPQWRLSRALLRLQAKLKE